MFLIDEKITEERSNNGKHYFIINCNNRWIFFLQIIWLIRESYFFIDKL